MSVRITILYNEPTLPADHPDADSEHDVIETVDIISKHLQSAGLSVSRFGTTGDAKSLIAGLTANAPDAVFNLFEGTAGWGQSEEYVAGVLELLKIPYTGCPTLPMTVCRNKPLAKRLFAGAGIPTAAYLVLPPGPVLDCPIPFPVIVKPGLEDASVGIDQKSVCETLKELNDRVEYLRSQYGPSVLVERLIVGREFHVPVIEIDGEPRVLPFTEILFPPPADGEPIWPIVTFDAKWKPASRDFAATPAKNPAEVDDHLHKHVCDVVMKTFKLLDCRDYARVDLRVDSSNQPYVLEMNPNPCINPLAGVAAALESAKISYADFILGCVRNALRRGPKPELATFDVTNTIATSPPKSNDRVKIRMQANTDDGVDPNAWEPFDQTMSKTDIELMKQLIACKHSHDGISFLAIQDSHTVGIARLNKPDAIHADIWRLNLICVTKSNRRQSIGHSMLDECERHVVAEGGRLLIAEISSSPGFGAVRQLLLTQGYRQVGDCPEFYKDHCSNLTFAKVFPAVLESPSVGGSGVVDSTGIGRAVTGGGLL